MNEPDRGRLWIDNVNRAAVGDMNSECDPGLSCNETIAPREMFVRLDRCIDNFNLVSVNLFGSEQRPTIHPDGAANFAMNCVQSPQRFGFVVRNINACDSLGEDVPGNSARIDRRKTLDWKLLHDSRHTGSEVSRSFRDLILKRCERAFQ